MTCAHKRARLHFTRLQARCQNTTVPGVSLFHDLRTTYARPAACREELALFQNVLRGMLETHAQQLLDVLVGEAVEHALAVAPGAHQAAVAKQPELVGDGRLRDMADLLQVRHALLAAHELAQDLEARRASQVWGVSFAMGILSRVPVSVPVRGPTLRFANAPCGAGGRAR